MAAKKKYLAGKNNEKLTPNQENEKDQVSQKRDSKEQNLIFQSQKPNFINSNQTETLPRATIQKKKPPKEIEEKPKKTLYEIFLQKIFIIPDRLKKDDGLDYEITILG